MKEHDARGGPLISASGVSKVFGATKALRAFNFVLHPGQIHALVGENGAGKSTFIKILAGLYTPDSGTIELSKAEGGGSAVAFIHQDLGLVPGLSVAENVLLGTRYPGKWGLIDWKAVDAVAERALARVNADIEPGVDIGSLSMADRALVAIARALRREARALVLDEPTATLPGADVQKLFTILEQLRRAGIGMIYVSHRLSEILEIADDVTVVRDGKISFHGPTVDLTEAKLMEYMIGHGFSADHQTDDQLEKHRTSGASLLEIASLASDSLRVENLSVNAGEIVGCVGLRGAGQELLGRTLMGLTPFSGAVEVGGLSYCPRDVADALRHGISYVTGNRDEAIVRAMTVQENIFVNPRFSPLPSWIRLPAIERRFSKKAIAAYDVRPSEPDASMGDLSGGNAQKVVFARGMGNTPSLVIMDDPTAGVDMPTRFSLYRMMRAQAAQGTAFLVISSDYEEVASVCDRIHVFRSGCIAASLSEPPFDAEAISQLASRDLQ